MGNVSLTELLAQAGDSEAGAAFNEFMHSIARTAFMAGVPSREQARVFNNASGTSPGEVSRLWEREGLRCIEQVRGRNLSLEDYVVLMLDGIWLSDDLCVIVVLGITLSGEKNILDF